jgi:hypothetical protein
MSFNAELTRKGEFKATGRVQIPAINHGPAPFIENKRYAQEGRAVALVVNRNVYSVYQTECDFKSHENRAATSPI